MRVLAAVLAITIALAGVALGCGSSAPEKVAPKRHSGPVPRSLDQTESAAEDLIDLAFARKRARVVAKARELRGVAQGAASADLRRAGVSEGRLGLFRDQAKAVATLAPHAPFLRISLGANQISAFMPEFFARFSNPVPPQVLELDYLDREAELRGLAGDEPGARGAVRRLSATWSALRRRTIDAGGRRVATRYSRHVAAMGRLASRSKGLAFHRKAVSGLELVDELEGVFRKR